MRNIRQLVRRYEDRLLWSEFDVRQTGEVPGTDFDIYISSGGPGSPLEGDGVWDRRYFDLIDALWQHNRGEILPKKFVFFICHSFQMACHHFGLGLIAPRKSTSFGIFPIHKTPAGREDWLLADLADPYYAVDSRDWQLIQPNLRVFRSKGATILSLEKIRTHVEYERAIMAVRFSPEVVGTQFHPEANPEGMKAHFQQEEMRQKVITNFGEKKYLDMMTSLDDPEKIALTHRSILPRFIEHALAHLQDPKL
ncbi:MAG: hypothetical protein OHK0039_49340 [Bacteroidia bacterium]